MKKFYSIIILFLTISTAAFAQNLPLHQFANIYGGPDSSEFPNGFGKDAAGNIYVSGQFSGVNVDFNPGAGNTNTTTNGFYDGYIAKYNSSGVFQWLIQIGGRCRSAA